MRDYNNIKAFKHSDRLVLDVYKLTKDFPKEELYGLTSQLRRAAVSVAANIVEGASRKYNKDYVHFLYIARGSLAESKYLLSLAKQLGYIDMQITESVFGKLDEASKTLYGLISSIEKDMA